MKDKKPLGRPTVNTEPLTVRMTHEILIAIDAVRRDISRIPSRPEIVRLAVSDWLKMKGYLQ
jgi:hypothetical protein